MTRQRWMAVCFALGSTCFLIGPFPGYVQLVGESADAITFFVGSILFTLGGGLQSWLAWPERRDPDGGRAAWWAAIIQSAGTLFFNVTTYQAMDVGPTSSEYNTLVWRPDWRGSICFLVSGGIAYVASPRSALAAAARRRGLVAAGGEPARLHLLRDLGRRRLRRARDRLDARPGRVQLEHLTRRCVLPGLRAGHAAYRRGLEDADPTPVAQARAWARDRGQTGHLRRKLGSPIVP